MKPLKFALIVVSASLLFGCVKDPDIFISNKPPIAFAGRDTTLQLTKTINGFQLSGSANDSDGVVTGYLWSQYSGPAQAAIVSPAAASTMAANLVAGDYVFQLMAIDDDGATGLDFVTLKVLAAKLFTDTFNLKNNPGETVIASIFGGNNTRLQELPASYWTSNGASVESRSLLKYDFSSLPAGAKIVSAKLSLYAVPNPLNGNQVDAHSGDSNAVYIRRIITNWSPASLNWTNQPATTTANQLELAATAEPFKNYINLDVTALVQDMVSGSNYGLMLQLKSLNELYTIQNFASSKHADHSKHPRLVVMYEN